MNIFRQEIRTGLLVVFTLGVLITLMLYLGAPGVFVPQKSVVIYIDNASGLKAGANVGLAGRYVGQVVSLESPVPEEERPDPKKEVKINVKVNRSALIYRRTACTLTSTGLLGEIYVDFTQGVQASGLAPEGFAFIAEKPPGLDQAVPMVLEAIDPALKAVNETLGSLKETSDNLADLTKKGGQIDSTVAEFKKFAANIEEISSKTGPLRLTLDNLQTLTGPEGKVQLALGNIQHLTEPGSSLDKTLKNAETFTGNLANNKDLEATLRNAKNTTANLNKTVGELSGKLNGVAENLEEATDTLKRQPWRLVWPSTKKYGDEQEKKAEPKKKSSGKKRR
jgi:ABC-type transporter Mla subunit MlaD